MKIKCDKCGKDISFLVDRNFEQFAIGRVVCHHCNKKQQRWLTQFDLMMYLGMSGIFYMFTAYIVTTLMNNMGFEWWVFLILLAVYLILYIILKTIDRQIYLKAPFKKEWMNKEIYEDHEAVRKKMRIEFIIYFVVIIMMATGTYPLWSFLLITALYAIMSISKLYSLYKNEKTSTKL